jgi:hypothetical protein
MFMLVTGCNAKDIKSLSVGKQKQGENWLIPPGAVWD